MSDNDDTLPTAASEEGSLRRGLRRSALLLLLGLAAEALSLIGLNTPIGFMAFAIFGGSLIVAGMLSFLWVISQGPRPILKR